jgi:hypothetical protein
MAKKKAEEAGDVAIVMYPGPGALPAARKTFLTHGSDGFEVSLGGNTLEIPGPGTIEVQSDSPEWSPLQVAQHIAAQCLKRGGYVIEEK